MVELKAVLLYFLGAFQAIRPYLRLSAIDVYSIEMQALSKVYEQNVCLYESVQIDEHPAWWNIIGNIRGQGFINQERKAARRMLSLELTQKILQVKELAAKIGQWPKSIPDMESSICPGFQWVYQVKEIAKKELTRMQRLIPI